MVRETLLLSSNTDVETRNPSTSPPSGGLPNLSSYIKVSSGRDVTLNELTLLSSRGLRHEESGRHSALGTIQDSLDGIINQCFSQWAQVALSGPTELLTKNASQFMDISSSTGEAEYQRMYGKGSTTNGVATNGAEPIVGTASPYIIDYLVEVSFVLNRSISPSDSIVPVPSLDHAASMGISMNGGANTIPTMHDLIRESLLAESFVAVTDAMETLVQHKIPIPSAQLQVKNDLLFIQESFCERGRRDHPRFVEAQQRLSKSVNTCNAMMVSFGPSVESKIKQNQQFVLESCDLFLSSLLGETPTKTSAAGLSSAPTTDFTGSGAKHLLHAPLPSSCRFSLLPVQSDRTAADIKYRETVEERREANNRNGSTSGGGVVRSGFGFLSSMLKKN